MKYSSELLPAGIFGGGLFHLTPVDLPILANRPICRFTVPANRPVYRLLGPLLYCMQGWKNLRSLKKVFRFLGYLGFLGL